MSYTLVSLDPITNEVQSELPGLAPDHLCAVCLSSVNRFLENARVWRYDTTPELTGAVVNFVAPTGATVIGYRDLKWTEGVNHGRTTFKTNQPDEITLDPIPDTFTVGDLEVTLLLKVAEGRDEIPDFILNTHKEVMRSTTMARLMLEPSKPYSNPELGLLYAQESQRRTSEARDMAERMYGNNESRWTFPRWA